MFTYITNRYLSSNRHHHASSNDCRHTGAANLLLVCVDAERAAVQVEQVRTAHRFTHLCAKEL